MSNFDFKAVLSSSDERKIQNYIQTHIADVNEVVDEATGRTALHILGAGSVETDQTRKLAIAKELLVNGADPNKRDKDNLTVLQYAVDRGDRQLARLLLEFKADSSLVINTSPNSQTKTATDPNSVVTKPILSSPALSPASPFTEILHYLAEADKLLSNSKLSSLEIGAIEGALSVLAKKVNSSK
jgi:ankyrin repeat protein